MGLVTSSHFELTCDVCQVEQTEGEEMQPEGWRLLNLGASPSLLVGPKCAAAGVLIRWTDDGAPEVQSATR